MKSIVGLFLSALTEAGEIHQVRTHKDKEYSLSRIDQEGLSFLTITLPAFEKDLLRLISGHASSDLFHGFRKRGGLPTFLSGFLRLLIDKDGTISVPDPAVLRSLRQILLVASKVEMPVSSERTYTAISNYINTDAELEEIDASYLEAFRRASQTLLGPYFHEVERRIWSGSWRPRHSSGALATRETANSRYGFNTWTERLHRVLPWWDELTTFPSESYDFDVQILTPENEPPVKVVTVPKTMKTPRIIAEEPVHMQYVQQGILHVMTEVLQEKRFEHLAQVFSWLDQTPNRELARRGSIDGSYATIDLSEASDRVSHKLALSLFPAGSYIQQVIDAARSTRAVLPDGRVVELNKFASMGSSICFPIESMVFYVICSMASHAMSPLEVAPSFRRMPVNTDMRVYGDDLIVPSIVAPYLIQYLNLFGLKVNASKTFTTGHFRESCGSDWYRGYDVSVFKLRAPFPGSGQNVELLRSTIEFHNHAYGAGWFLVAEYVETTLRAVRHIPRVPVGLDTHALWSHTGPYIVRHNVNLQRPEFKTLVFRERKPSDPVDGYAALKKCIPLSVEPRERNHLERDGRSQCVGVITGWIN